MPLREKAKYDSIAPFYDFLEGPMEAMGLSRWRRRLWQEVSGGKVLEVGVGTGKNMPFYGNGREVTAIDNSPKMLARAGKRAQKLGLQVGLGVMDAQELALPSASFDTVVASFVFCSVADPVKGLKEVIRVCRPGGRVVLLEHMRSNTPLGWFMDLLNLIIAPLWGENINRRTMDNLRKAGLVVEKEVNLFLDIARLIVARPPVQGEVNPDFP